MNKTISDNPFFQEYRKQNPEAPVKQPVSKAEKAVSDNPFYKDYKSSSLEQGNDNNESEEGFIKSLGRSLLQIPAGIAKKSTYLADVIPLIGQGEAIAEFDELEERLPELMKKFPNAPWENFKGLDREKYMQAVQEAGDSFPKQENLENFLEERFGIPLEPKTDIQKKLRLGGTAAGFRPGSLSSKVTAGIVAPIVAKGLEAAGVPEAPAEIAGLVASGLSPSPKIGAKTKPSGLTERRFENLKKDTKVSPARSEIIKETVEKDFRKIADKILEKNPTYSALKEDSMFKEKIGDLFSEVETLAKDIQKEIPTEQLNNAFSKRYNSREVKGISPDEFEKSFRKEVRSIKKTIPYGEFTPSEGVEQFRKNNKSLKELFEPGKSSAANRAKREAILEYNRSIEDVFNKNFPDSEFNKLFKFTNERWKEIMDVENIQEFMGDIFDKKINFNKAKQIFSRDKERITTPFKRLIGEEGFNDFKALTEDLLSSEKAMGHIKKAESAGFTKLAEVALHYTISPSTAKVATGAKFVKGIYKMLLDKPKISITWKNALQDLEKGNYSQAEKGFIIVDQAFRQYNDEE